jgi:predicted  nucleic acid-binding Zn-ribbon protein
LLKCGLFFAAALDSLKRVEAEYAESSSVFDRYEKQISQNQTDISRLVHRFVVVCLFNSEPTNFPRARSKQRQIDQLNQQLDGLRAQRLAEGAGRLDMSPTELEIHRLQREITALASDSGIKQQRWLARQNELVGLTKELNDKRDEVEEMKTRLTVYHEKRLRLVAELEAHNKDCATSLAQFNVLRNELTRVNVVLNQNAGTQQVLLLAGLLLGFAFNSYFPRLDRNWPSSTWSWKRKFPPNCKTKNGCQFGCRTKFQRPTRSSSSSTLQSPTATSRSCCGNARLHWRRK